jgi:hypothetical protein
MKTVLELGNLFIPEFDWLDLEKRDRFLQHLLDNLENINKYKVTKVYWTDELEKLLWDCPQFPPWRLHRDWNLPIVQIMYKAFSEAREFLENPKGLASCLVQPTINCDRFGEAALRSFLELMHIVIDRNENVYLCLPSDRHKEEFNFLCDCHDLKITPLVISRPVEWLDHVKLTTEHWPVDVSEIDKLKTILEITFKKINKNPVNEYEFSNSFLKDIVKANNHRESIIQYTARRLTLTRQEASGDSHLQDEYLSQKKEYRFRITQRPFSTRVHYKYVNKKLRFLRYYDEGEHDDGL